MGCPCAHESSRTILLVEAPSDMPRLDARDVSGLLQDGLGQWQVHECQDLHVAKEGYEFRKPRAGGQPDEGQNLKNLSNRAGPFPEFQRYTEFRLQPPCHPGFIFLVQSQVVV